MGTRRIFRNVGKNENAQKGLARRRQRGLRDQRGAALAEYGLLVAGITLVSLVAVSLLGSKVGGLVGSVASMLPSAVSSQNAPVAVGQLIETNTRDLDGDGQLEVTLDAAGIADQGQGTNRMAGGLGVSSHDASHLIQLGSQGNRFHGGAAR